MAGLICLWNSNGMRCEVVAMLLVEVVMCWDFMVMVWFWFGDGLVWWSFGFMVMVFVDKCGFALLGSMRSLGSEVDEGWYVVFLRVLWVGWDGMWYGKWAVVWNVSEGEGEDEGELRLNGWWLSDGVDLCVCCDVWWVFGWYGEGCCDLVWVEEWFWEVGRIYWVPVVLRIGWVHCVIVVLRIGWIVLCGSGGVSLSGSIRRWMFYWSEPWFEIIGVFGGFFFGFFVFLFG